MVMTPDPDRLNEVVFLDGDHDTRKFTEGELTEFIRNTYPPPEYVVLDHIRNSTGFLRDVRTADAIMFSTYPSRGLHLYGMEIKCNRGDWLSELRNPEKAEEIGRYCDFWYIVAPVGVVRDGEVPRNWGWLIPGRTRLSERKKPVENEMAQPLSRGFVASIMRKFHERTLTQDELKQEREIGRKMGRREMKRELTKDDPIAVQLRREVDDLKKRIDEFKETSGIDISEGWSSRRIGEAVSFIVRHGYSLEHVMKTMRDNMKQLLAVTNDYENQFSISKR